MPLANTSAVLHYIKFFKMADGSDRCSGETLLARCARKKRLRRKMIKYNCWMGAQETAGIFSKSSNDRDSFIYLSPKQKLILC